METKKPGCGDHSCVFGPPKGMGTNGGCRCFLDVQRACRLSDNVGSSDEFRRLLYGIRWQRARIEELELSSAAIQTAANA